MNASDVMVHNVITIGPEDNIAEAAKQLVDHDISALPVVDGEGRLIGILSEADLIHRKEVDTEKRRPWWMEAILPATILSEDYAKSHGRKVGEVMSPHLVTAAEDTPLSEIATLMEKHRIKRIPIVRDGRLIGIVSRANLIQALASTVTMQHETLDDDRAIRREILSRLANQSWTDFGERNIVVTKGVAHLWGLVGSPEERKALRALVETVPGVRSISDEMIAAYD